MPIPINPKDIQPMNRGSASCEAFSSRDADWTSSSSAQTSTSALHSGEGWQAEDGFYCAFVVRRIKLTKGNYNLC